MMAAFAPSEGRLSELRISRKA
jgi:hypothetical protein